MKYRAKLLILSAVISFPTIRNKDWTAADFDMRGSERPGDLIAMNSAPPSKWYLSWLHETNPNNGWPKYLLESIEDGALCWWENVGISFYNREQLRPSWRWTDSQFKLNDRWMKACRKNNAFIVIPLPSQFNDDGSVVLDVRIRYALDNYCNPRTFPNWKKVTIKEMDAYYKECLIGYEQKPKLHVAT